MNKRIFSGIKAIARMYFHKVKNKKHLLVEYIRGIICSLQVKKMFNDEQNVFLVEFNQWHSEVLPGYCKYFEDLGFNVFVITRYNGYLDNPFCLFEKQPKRFCMNLSQMKKLFQKVDFRKIAYTLVTSERIYFNKKQKISWTLVWDFIGRPPVGKYGCGIIAHGLADSQHVYIPNNQRCWDFNQVLDKTFVLTPFQLNGIRSMPMLNPFYFGEIERHKKNNKTVFIVIGTISREKRNFQELLSSFSQLAGNWELIVIGAVKEPEIFQSLPENIKVMGRLSFSEMYDNLKKADFFLPLLDPEDDLHFRYKNDSTSGSRQLILGFSIVPVIDCLFGTHYGFSEENSVFYKKGGLVTAMQCAIDMKNEKYQRMVDSLKKEADSVYNESMRNLTIQMNIPTPEKS